MILETQKYDPNGDVHLILMKEPHDILAEPVNIEGGVAGVPEPDMSATTSNEYVSTSILLQSSY
jgi:hypothetical protein